MSCYHPMMMQWTGEYTDTGKRKYKFAWKYETEEMLIDPYSVKVPCGQCIGCRLDHSRQWADRMLLELDHTGKGVFITLTYRDEDIGHLAVEGFDYAERYSLSVRDAQLFMKRLRKHFSNKEIRFYLSGEYGTKRNRPHFHAILFGLDLNDFQKYEFVKKNKFGDPYYKSEVLESLWPFGMSSLSEVSWKTCAYVSRYVMKKQLGKSKEIYQLKSITPEFALMSRRPGIGAYYLEDHDFDFEQSNISLKDQYSGKTISIPKFIFNKLEFIDLDLYNVLKQSRKDFAIDRELLKLQQSDLGIEELLSIEEERKTRSVATLLRPLDTEENLY